MIAEKEPDFDPEHPYIPIEMFLYLPRHQDDYFTGEGQTIRRYLFEGGAIRKLTGFELKKEEELHEYINRKQQKLPMEVLTDPFWTRSWKFRWLASDNYDPKKAIKSMEDHMKYMRNLKPQISPRALYLLQQGIFYVSGRDAYYRPILVFDVEKMLKLKMTIEELLQAQTVFFQKVLEDLLLPGQVETWVAVVDIGFQNLMSMVGPLKTSFGFLSNTFRCRMRYCYVVRPSGPVSFLWGITKKFLHEDTVKKINFVDNERIEELLKFTNPSQLEMKFGGSQPNMTEFWPIKTVHHNPYLNFSKQGLSIPRLTRHQYRTHYQEGELEGHVISKLLIQEDKPTQDQRLEEGQGSECSEKIIEWPVEPDPSRTGLVVLPEVACWSDSLWSDA